MVQFSRDCEVDFFFKSVTQYACGDEQGGKVTTIFFLTLSRNSEGTLEYFETG